MIKCRLSDEPRSLSHLDNGNKKSVLLRQITALIDFNDVESSTLSGWVDDENVLSQSGNCRMCDESALASPGATITGDVRITQASMIRDGAQIGDAVWISRAEISHDTQVRDSVTVRDSVVRGECLLCDNARAVCGSRVIAARGLARESDQLLQIYDRTTVGNSRVVHQAQIYGDTMISYAFIEHRAGASGSIRTEGSEENGVWICDCARVYGHVRVIAGTDKDAISILRYDLQVVEHAEVEGSCVLKHHILVGGHAKLHGSPVLLDGHILIEGYAYILGKVLIEHHIEVIGQVQVEVFDGDAIHPRGPRAINGE